jgi:hypothetical protein
MVSSLGPRSSHLAAGYATRRPSHLTVPGSITPDPAQSAVEAVEGRMRKQESVVMASCRTAESDSLRIGPPGWGRRANVAYPMDGFGEVAASTLPRRRRLSQEARQTIVADVNEDRTVACRGLASRDHSRRDISPDPRIAGNAPRSGGTLSAPPDVTQGE